MQTLLSVDPLRSAEGLPPYLTSYLSTRRDRFESPVDFAWCYAFDVYRRGSQYLAATSVESASAVYIPHAVRRASLNGIVSNWRPLTTQYPMLWSWGQYFHELLAEDAYKGKISPGILAKYLLSARARVLGGGPSWFDVPDFNQLNEDYPTSATRVLKSYWEQIETCASEAGLPLLRTRQESRRVKTIQGIAQALGLLAADVLTRSLTTFALAGITVIRLVGREIDADRLASWEINARSSSRALANKLKHGRFGYRGLTSPRYMI